MTVEQQANWPVNEARLWADAMALGDLTEPGRPYTRRAFSDMFLKGRAYLTDKFQAAGMAASIDAAGNLIGRLQGSDPKAGTLVIGSHSDTVPDGGRFDGIAGVLAGLEVVRAVKDAGLTLRHNLEIIDCLAEEMSVFGLSCIGSRGMTGHLTPEMLRYPGPDGEDLASGIKRMGGDVASLPSIVRDDIRAYLELHIEQGRVLEAAKLDIGVVTNIVGIMRLEITVTGLADHAGTTPMDLRRDALSGAVEVVAAIRDKARAIAGRDQGYFVATTGEFEIQPGAANVVPREVRLVIDARAEAPELMKEFLAFAQTELAPLAIAQGAEISALNILSDSAHTECNAHLQEHLAQSASDLGLSWRYMASGAGHDAVFFSRIAPAAMIFIPCLNGRSHTPEEWTEPGQLSAGAAVLFETIRRLDAAPDIKPHAAMRANKEV